MTDDTANRTAPKSLKANALWNAIGSFFYMGCQWLITVLVVSLSPNYDNSGILAFSMAIGLVFYAIGTYSIRPFQVSDIKNEYSPQNYVAFRLITNIGSFALCTLYLVAITKKTDLIITSILYMIFKFDESFCDVLFGIDQRNNRMDFIGRSLIARGVVSLVAFSVPLWATTDINLAIICMTIGCMLITFIYDIPHSTLFGTIVPHVSKAKVKQLFKTCFLAMLANLMLTYVVSAVRQYYGIVEGDSALGIYAAIATPAVVVQASIGYIYTPFIVTLAKAFHESRMAFIKRFLTVLLILAVAIFLLSVVLCLAGPILLSLAFGESIVPHLYIFPYVIISTSLVGLMGYMFATLVTMRKQVLSCIMTAIAFVGSFGSSVPLIEAYGMNGVNLGIITGCVIGFIIGLIFVLACKNSCWKDKSKSQEVESG